MERIGRKVQRDLPVTFETRAEDEKLYIRGYFAVFGDVYNLWPGASESIAPGAFVESLGNDIRCLINHDTRLVLGRTKVGTASIREDSHGLWAEVEVNQKDQDAMNLYHRMERGDVDQGSIGFLIEEETTTESEGNIHWTIKKANLFEVSVVTFPAYEQTSVMARERADAEKRMLEKWRLDTRKKMKKEER